MPARQEGFLLIPFVTNESGNLHLRGSNYFVIYPFGFWGNVSDGIGLLHEKLKVLERFEKDGKKNMKKTLSRGKVVLRFVLVVENFLYPNICFDFMSLEEFLTDCKSKGSIPLSYRSETVTLKGKQIVEYVNPKYAKALNITKYERPDAGRVEDEY